MRVSFATQKIPKVFQDPPRLGIFFQKLGHIYIKIGIFMRGNRPTWIMAAEMENLPSG